MEDRIFSLLVEKDDITWKDIIFDLIKTEQINPWDINVGRLTSRYIEVVRKMREFDFKISGKVILAAALLLKIKSNKLVGEDINEFDKFFAPESDADEFYDDLARMRAPEEIPDLEKISLIPRTPQPRERKVSIYDLISALEKALEVKKRRIIKSTPDFEGIKIPAKNQDVTLTIKQMYKKILSFFLHAKERLTFSKLLSADSKEEKVRTFIPLLHLANERKIDLEQEKPFAEIGINLIDKERIAGGRNGSVESL